MEIRETRKVNPKLILILMIIIFLGPFGFALNMHQQAKKATLRHNNVGDLIMPVKQAQDLLFTSLDNQQDNPQPFQGNKLKGKWQLS